MDPFTVATSQLQDLITRLTPRQLQVVELLAQGRTLEDAASILSIGFDTARKHIYHACFKLDLDNRIQLIVVYAMWRAVENTKNQS